jgi:hypothetical protein
MRTFFGLVVFCCALGLGYWQMSKTKIFTQENEIAYSNPIRDPAAIRKDYDFSSLVDSELTIAQKHRLVNGVYVAKESDYTSVSLGHFVLRSSESTKEFACERYDTVQLLFEGQGVAVNGENSVMEVEGKCEVSTTDLSQTVGLKIPFKKITEHKPTSGDLVLGENETTKFKFANVSDSWPKSWYLKEIKLKNSKTGSELPVSETELRGIKSRPIIVE